MKDRGTGDGGSQPLHGVAAVLVAQRPVDGGLLLLGGFDRATLGVAPGDAVSSRSHSSTPTTCSPIPCLSTCLAALDPESRLEVLGVALRRANALMLIPHQEPL
jgi:hypothetical protein